MKKNKKVMFVCPYFFPHTGGSEQYVYKIARGLQEKYGWDVSVVTTNQDKKRLEKESLNGIKIYRLPVLFTFSNTPVNPFWYFQIKKIVKEEQPILINAHTPVPFIADIAALVSHKITYVLTYHGGSMLKKNSIFNIPIFIYENVFLNYVLRKAKIIICSSDYIRNVFLKNRKDKSLTINPGVDAVRKLVKKTSETKIVLFVASLAKSQSYKGLEYLLKAFVAVRSRVKDVKLTVVGDGDALSDYKKLAKDLKIERNVVFTGSLYGQKLNQMFKQSNVFVLPSLNESFGKVLIEAMAHGTPVIGTNVGGIPDVVTHGKEGFLVPPGDTAQLAKSIIRILENNSLANSLGKAGFEKVKANYLWSKQVSATNEVFEKLLS